MKNFGTAIILAGGKSSRMGFDKQFLTINKKRVMENIIHKLRDEFDEIIIVTNKPLEYSGLNYKVTCDILKDMGPLGGIHAGLSIAKSKYSMVIACDMPNINMDYIRYMKDHIGKDGCTTRFGDWIEPFSSFYSKDIVDDIEKYLLTGRKSIYHLLEKLHIKYIDEENARRFSPNWNMFLNLNTKKDLDDYLELIEKELSS